MRTKKVVIVDDFRSIREIVKNILEKKGFEVIESANGREAMKLFDGTSYALLITDYDMPLMDGASLVRKLRGMTQYTYIPVIMLTSSSEEKIHDKIKDLNIACFMKKPFDTNHFYSVIEKLT
jgi:two-component system chemotaxis response regulator CheY